MLALSPAAHKSLGVAETNTSSSTCNFGGLTWSRFVDGEKSWPGRDAFGPEYVDRMVKAWDQMQQPGWRLSVESLVDLQKKACRKKAAHFREHEVYAMMAHCTARMSDQTRAELMKDLPVRILDIIRGKHGKIDRFRPRMVISSSEIHNNLQEMIDTYNTNLKSHKPLTALSIFLRSIAWLHPFIDCNSRTRTLLLQYELQRLQLGCGAFMYNNNANIYVATTEEFVTLMKEGVRMGRIGLSTEVNPWHDNYVVTRHLKKFPMKAEFTGDDCAGRFEAGNKSIA